MTEPKLFANVEGRSNDLEIDCGCSWRIPWDTATIVARPCQTEGHRERLVECLEEAAEGMGVEVEVGEQEITIVEGGG